MKRRSSSRSNAPAAWACGRLQAVEPEFGDAVVFRRGVAAGADGGVRVLGQAVKLDVAADQQDFRHAGHQRAMGVDPIVLEGGAAEMRRSGKAEGELDHGVYSLDRDRPQAKAARASRLNFTPH
jgi:hypothetical protein